MGRPARRQGSSGLRPVNPETAARLQNGRGGFGTALRAAAFATRARAAFAWRTQSRILTPKCHQGMRLLISFKSA